MVGKRTVPGLEGTAWPEQPAGTLCPWWDGARRAQGRKAELWAGTPLQQHGEVVSQGSVLPQIEVHLESCCHANTPTALPICGFRT